MNLTLRIGLVRNPAMFSKCGSTVKTCPGQGPAVDAVLIFCNVMRIDCVFEWFDSGDYGDADEYGHNATGMIRAVQYGRYDTSLPVFTPTYNRYQAIDFSDPYFIYDQVLITRLPSRESIYGINCGFMSGFQLTVWFTLIAVFLVSTALLAYLVRRSGFLPSDHHFASTYSRVSIDLIARGLQFIYTSTIPIRILCGSWLMSSVILWGLYGGMLYSHKMIQRTAAPFMDLESFVYCMERSECRLIMHTTSISYYQQLTQGGSDLATRMRNTLHIHPPIIVDREKIPEMILNEHMYYLVWHGNKEYFYMKNKEGAYCKYHVVSSPFGDVETFPVRKNSSSVLSTMNKVSTLFRELGWESKLRGRYFRPNECVDHHDHPASNNYWFYSFGSVLYFYCFGMSVATLALVTELCRHKNNRRYSP